MSSSRYALEVYKRTTKFLEDFANKRIYTKYYVKWADLGAGLLSPQEKFKIINDINKRYRYFLEVNNEGPEFFTVQITDMSKSIEGLKYELVYKIVKNIFNIVKYRNDNERIELEWTDIVDFPVPMSIIEIVVKGMKKYGIKVVFYSNDSIHFINNSEITKNQLMELKDTGEENNYVIPEPNNTLVLESKDDKEQAKEEPEIKLRPDGVAETIVKITR